MNKLLKRLSTCEPLFVGISLSFCIKEIINGDKKLSDIIGIISNTKFTDSDQFIELCKTYGKTYWKEDPQLGFAIAHYLRESEAIFQPRAEDDDDMWSHQLNPEEGGYWFQINPSASQYSVSHNKSRLGDPPVLEELINGDKVDAIRELRKQTGLDLMHCKKAVEAMLEYRERLPLGDES
jgi:hypothetical protein